MEGCSTSLEPDGRKHCPWTVYRVLLITDDKSFTECKQEWTSPQTELCRDNRTTSWGTLDKRTAWKAQMSPPRVDLIRAIISGDSLKSCRKEQRQSSRGGMHWGKPQHSESAVMRGWTGMWESRLDVHPYREDTNLVLSLSSNFSGWALTSHLRSPEVKGHCPIHSKALLPSPLHCISQGDEIPPHFCSTWGLSVTTFLFSGRTTAPDTRGLQVWLGQKTGEHETHKWHPEVG